MTWYEKVIAAHTAVTDAVSHGQRLKSDRYFVWQEEGSNDLEAEGKHAISVVTGSTDLYSKTEFDVWKEAFESALDSIVGITWYLDDVQFEPETGFWHWMWNWEAVSG